MKVLLDENLDPRLRDHLLSVKFPIEILSVKDMNWLGLKNGELLTKASNQNFDIFLSADSNINHQQNLSKYLVNIVVLKMFKNNFTSQLLKIPELKLLFERINKEKPISNYFEI